MQWLLLAVTFIITAILQRFARAAGTGGQLPVEARATLSLGLLLLAAYIAGTLAQRIRLPRIVGYLLAGFISGPAWLRLIRVDELQALSVISTGALAVLAFAAGSMFTIDAFRGQRRGELLRVTAGATAIPFLLVTLVTLTVSAWFPLTAHQPFRDGLVVALVLGAFAATASPTITWAVIRDFDARSRGPLSRTVMDVSIVQTIGAAALLIVVLAFASVVASDGAVVPGSSMRALLHLVGSAGTGAALGVALAQYLRPASGPGPGPGSWLAGGMRVAWLLLGLAFIIAQIVRLTGLGAVVIGLTAGFTLRNWAPAAHERLNGELERCAVPVNVVFFSLAGAALSFNSLDELRLWPWAILLVALRINGLRWGLQLAGRSWRGESPVSADVSRYGWLGLVSQGGMAITLAAVLRSAFPEWNVSLEALLVAMIGCHALIGPICFQWALRRTGEVTERRGELDAPQTALVADRDSLVTRV
ncbi:MAG TPA: cation:proton antiporter [Gemmatimonadales bacterium]|nr:cation:proton antiporter [Gemmatimonadales bacterium]